MNHSEIEYHPLSNVFEGISALDDLTPETVRAELIDKGYNLDAFISHIENKVSVLSSEVRLSWMTKGDAIQTVLNTALTGITSWTTRTTAEVNLAFDDLLAGRYGTEAQLRMQTAFKNVTSLTTESKAALLDEVGALIALKATEPQKKQGQ